MTSRRTFLASVASTGLAACSGGAALAPGALSLGAGVGLRSRWIATPISQGSAYGVAIDSASGILYAAVLNAVLRVAPGGMVTTLHSQLVGCRSVAFDPKTSGVYAADNTTGEIW